MEERRIIKYDIDELGGIACMDDFYSKLGILSILADMDGEGASRIFINSESNELIKLFIIKNAINDDRFSFLKEYPYDQYKNICVKDWLYFAPLSRDDIPRDEVWLLSRGDDEIDKA